MLLHATAITFYALRIQDVLKWILLFLSVFKDWRANQQAVIRYSSYSKCLNS